MKRFNLYIQVITTQNPKTYQWYKWGKYKTLSGATQAFNSLATPTPIGPIAKIVDTVGDGVSFIGAEMENLNICGDRRRCEDG